MKLVITIISNKDIQSLTAKLSENSFSFTRIATSGQFLENGHTTFLIGVADEKVDALFDTIQSGVTKRVIRKKGVENNIEGSLLKKPVDVEEYGAVAFIVNVDEFKKF